MIYRLEPSCFSEFPFSLARVLACHWEMSGAVLSLVLCQYLWSRTVKTTNAAFFVRQFAGLGTFPARVSAIVWSRYQRLVGEDAGLFRFYLSRQVLELVVELGNWPPRNQLFVQ
jgi:hypothetical protein